MSIKQFQPIAEQGRKYILDILPARGGGVSGGSRGFRRGQKSRKDGKRGTGVGNLQNASFPEMQAGKKQN